jgi:hypothetical protein
MVLSLLESNAPPRASEVLMMSSTVGLWWAVVHPHSTSNEADLHTNTRTLVQK